MTAFLTNDLISQVIDRTFLPGNQAVFPNQQIYNYANNEMRDTVFQFVQSKHEDYYVQALNIPLIGQPTSIRLPYRGINSNIRNMDYYDNNNNVFHLPVMQIRDEDQFRAQNNSNRPSGFYLTSSYFQLLPSQTTYNTGSLELKYIFAPNQLSDVITCGLILSAVTTNITYMSQPYIQTVITVSGLFPSWTTTSLFDIITTQASYECTDFDMAGLNSVAASGGNTVLTYLTPQDNSYQGNSNYNKGLNQGTFYAFGACYYDIAVGSYLCPAQTSCVVQLPDNCRQYLIERVAAKLFQTWGKADHANICLENCSKMQRDIASNIANRATEPVKLIRKYGLLRNNRNTFRGNATVA